MANSAPRAKNCIRLGLAVVVTSVLASCAVIPLGHHGGHGRLGAIIAPPGNGANHHNDRSSRNQNYRSHRGSGHGDYGRSNPRRSRY